jgi:hypothetical protein
MVSVVSGPLSTLSFEIKFLKWSTNWSIEILCKILFNSYKRALSIFNDIHSDENRMKLNLEKQKYKRLENKLKRQFNFRIFFKNVS